MSGNVYSSEEVKEIMDDMIAKGREEEAKKPRHGYKKGQYLWVEDTRHHMSTYAKVIECSETILLIRNIEFPGCISYRIEPAEWSTLKLMTKKEYFKLKLKNMCGHFLHSIVYGIQFICKIFGLKYSSEPTNVFQYIANWLAFICCLLVRINDKIRDPGTNFSGITSHGPLFPSFKKKK